MSTFIGTPGNDTLLGTTGAGSGFARTFLNRK